VGRFARSHGAVAAAAVAFALSVSSPVHATVAVALSRTELVDRSDLVVLANVVGQQSQWNDSHTQIVTLTHLRVASYMKGTGEQDLVLRQFGGTVGDQTLVVPGDAHLAVGDQAVLFLRRGDGVVFLTAMAQAAYEVQAPPTTGPVSGGATVARRDLHELTLAVRQGGRYVMLPTASEPSETLEHLTRDVTSIVRGGR
jgi:hypothetical protein